MEGASAQSRPRQVLPGRVHSPRAKLVYLYLRVVGESDVATLRRDLGMSALSLLAVLRVLEDRGLVERGRAGYAARDHGRGARQG